MASDVENDSGEGSGAMKEWKQTRVRLPIDLYHEIEEEALQQGVKPQQVILTRVQRGSPKYRARLRSVDGTRAYAQLKGELDVAEKMVASLAAIIHNMQTTATAEASTAVEEDAPGPYMSYEDDD